MKQIDEFTQELDESDCRQRIAAMASVLGISVDDAMSRSFEDLSQTLAGTKILQMRFLLGEP
jgi:hypothetical protein